MNFLDTFGQMGVLFILVIIGFICHKLKIMSVSLDRSLSVLIINVTAPAIILSSVMGDTLPAREEILPVLLIGTMTLVIMLVAGCIFARLLHSQQEGIYRFMFAFGNINFIGIPVVAALFGNYAIFYISVLTIPFNLLVFLLGQIFIRSCKVEPDPDTTPEFKAEDLPPRAKRISLNWRMILSPALCSTYIVIALVYFQIKTPALIGQAFSLVGQMTIPASLLVIGSTLAEIKVLEMLGSWRIYVMSGLKLLGIPCLIYGIYMLSPFDHKYTDVLVILSAMPVASYGTMICLKEGIDPKVMSQGTFMSTLLSVFTIPILALIL
ncbi:MAG TPA: AEC family transporter [Candidatus Anaerobiospirillum pullistercoris]|uniref:AEC family transporter n=1 Tax=Candidatus Anaerobiospirillum pullistercoris TaxID=2838452 RepID=A0A9D1WF15_9GAMM|nr:AEC family transporter [Candidatus Anaerobiospirillum pullistercoris]